MLMEKLKSISIHQGLVTWIKEHVPSMSAASLHLLSVILLHSATLPSLLAVLLNLSDKMPLLDMTILIWAGLIAMFAQAIVMRNTMIAVVIALGFMCQSIMMALIFFR